MFQIKVVNLSRDTNHKQIQISNERQMQLGLLCIHIFMPFKQSNMIG